MLEDDFRELVNEATREARSGRSLSFVGLNRDAERLISELRTAGCGEKLEALYVVEALPVAPLCGLGIEIRPLSSLARYRTDVLVVTVDLGKEDLLRAALPYIHNLPKILFGGYRHFAFRNRIFEEELARLSIPSLANGYPNSLVHLYQCLENASRRGLTGVVVELGMFRGGTTMFLARAIERLGAGWRIIGFDSFAGFPSRRSPLDMYNHADLSATNEGDVRRYLAGRNVEVVPGDIVKTCRRLSEEDLVVTFFDTDNFSSASAALDFVQERTVVGGAIVFDHFTGVDRFKYTLGERMAGERLLADGRYFHLHGTGVFFRQR